MISDSEILYCINSAELSRVSYLIYLFIERHDVSLHNSTQVVCTDTAFLATLFFFQGNMKAPLSKDGFTCFFLECGQTIIITSSNTMSPPSHVPEGLVAFLLLGLLAIREKVPCHEKLEEIL